VLAVATSVKFAGYVLALLVALGIVAFIR
jgi:hypothetical protein